MKSRKYSIYGWVLLALLIQVLGCSKKPNDYRSFLEGKELVYPGIVSNPQVLPGNGRLMLTWNPNPDPSIRKYVVYWNNKGDSIVLNATSHNTADTVKCIINNLAEYVYTFFIYSYDSIGNRSVTTEIDNAKVYGPIYRSGLHNRPPNTSNPSVVNADGSATLHFLALIDTINITTTIKYTDNTGATITRFLSRDSGNITLPNYKMSTKVTYQSSFIPKKGAIDTFNTITVDTFPPVYTYVMCDKSLFNTITLANDLKQYDASTYLARIWDGNMQARDYPNVFHSNGSPATPGNITFDMGKIYANIGRIEETGRTCCHNPTDFEVWGIADTTGALSSLGGNNSGWKADMLAKGWTMLGEVIRTDDGMAPFDAGLMNNPPPVRFIIIRILDTYNHSGYVNISQVTFWNRQ